LNQYRLRFKDHRVACFSRVGSSLVRFEIIFGTVERSSSSSGNGYYNDDSSR